MFNFLSVLVCLLGSLMLMAVAFTAITVQKVIPVAALNIVVKKVPIVVDCKEEIGQTLDDSRRFSLRTELRLLLEGRLEESDFLKFVKQLKSREFVFFVVRPSGINTFTVLKGVLDKYNDTVTDREVALSAAPEAADLENLPRPLRKKISFRGNYLKFLGRMTWEEMLLLQQLFDNGRDRLAVERLYHQSQKTSLPLDHGLEIVPEDWTISIEQQDQEDQRKDGPR